MELTAQPLLLRCLALTGAFETGKGSPGCFSGLAGDFDGMGLSFGALQWNLGQGTLQPLLQEMLVAHPEVAAQVLGDGFAALRRMLAMPREAQLQWARSLQDSKVHVIWQPWPKRFFALGQTPEFQAIQMKHAETMHEDALAMCDHFGLETERGLALMFDIRVQNGTIGPETEALIRADFAAGAGEEGAKLRAIANRRAEAANHRFVADVRARKLTIANGAGEVHGVSYDLAGQFGIRLAAR